MGRVPVGNDCDVTFGRNDIRRVVNVIYYVETERHLRALFQRYVSESLNFVIMIS